MDAPSITQPGDRAEQRRAEALILEGLSVALGVALVPRTFPMANHIRVSVDGVSDDPAVLVEVWAHQGPPKSPQKAKVITDALKLIWIDRALYEGRARKILALADAAAAGHFIGRTWMATALLDLGVEVHVVQLPEEARERIRRAQERQFR